MTGLAPLLFLLALLTIFLSSCTPPTTVPIGSVNFSLSGGPRHDTLLVFLPGLRDEPAVFAEKGIVSAVERSGIKADMIGVDAHVGYYKKKELLKRVKEDVIDPSRERGYRNIWLVGISLGGFGALWYDVEYPGELTGVVALSPYLGEPEVAAEVAKAGGLAAWNPPAGPVLDDQHRIWQGVKCYERREMRLKRLYLGYGLRDKFALPGSLLAAVLPGDQVFTMDGGHTWPVWRALWDRILRSGAFDRDGGD